MVNLVVFDKLDPFEPIWTLLDHFRQKSICCSMRTKQGLAEVLLSKKSFESFEMFQQGPQGSQMVKNFQVDHFGPFWAPLDHFGMLTSLPCLAIFVCFDGAFFGHPTYIISKEISILLISLSLSLPYALQSFQAYLQSKSGS